MPTQTPEIGTTIRNSRLKSHTETRIPRRKKLFAFFTLGCGRYSSMAASVHRPEPISPEKIGRRRKKKNRRRNNVADVCCTPPGIGFTYDVAENTIADSHRRRNRRQRSRSTRHAVDLQRPWSTDTALIRSNVVSDSRQFNRLHRRSVSEIVMFEHNPLLEGRLEGSDRFGAWRINADIMSYEELVELSDQIGYVDGGLQEEEILECLKRPKKSFFKSFDFNSKVKDSKCSICQEECKGDEDLGRLECGHYHHLDCIKQWLLRKNECPICKTVAKPDK